MKNDVNVPSKITGVISKKTWSLTKVQYLEPVPDPLVRGTDPRIWIRICPKMSRIRIRICIKMGWISNKACKRMGYRLTFERLCFRDKYSNLSLRQNRNVLLCIWGTWRYRYCICSVTQLFHLIADVYHDLPRTRLQLAHWLLLALGQGCHHQLANHPHQVEIIRVSPPPHFCEIFLNFIVIII